MKFIKSLFTVCALITGLPFANTQTLAPLQSTVLWKISGNGLQQESYIYLTTAQCDSKIILSNKVKQALEKVKVIAVESNLNSKTNVGKLPMLISAQNDSQRIKNVLPVPAFTELIKTAKEGYGMNEQILNQFKPFYISAFLLRNANPCESPSVDRIEDVLNDYAKKNSIEYKELLSPEEVVAEYDTYPTQYWQQNIIYLFNNAEQVKSGLQNKNALYGAENIEGLKKLFSSNAYYKTKYTTSIIQEHGQTILSKIEPLIKTQSTLITIDAGYFLTTDNSLFEQMKKAGYNFIAVTEK